jgi:hypothetical protein
VRGRDKYRRYKGKEEGERMGGGEGEGEREKS